MRIEKERLKFLLKRSIAIGIITLIATYFFPIRLETGFIMGGTLALILSMLME